MTPDELQKLIVYICTRWRYIRRPARMRDARPSFARVYVVDEFFTADGYDYVFLKAQEPRLVVP